MGELLSNKDLGALVDRLLLEQGRLDPLELLLAAGLLAYEDYEAWRMGSRPYIQGALQGTPADVAELLEQAVRYCAGLQLAAAPSEHRRWGSLDETLCVGDHERLVGACASVFAPPKDRPQLDLFQDSTALLLEEEIRRALAERRTDRAREQVARLMQQDPRHRHLRGFLRLIQVIDDSDIASPQERLQQLLSIEPLVRELLAHRDRDFLAPLWSALAELLTGRSFEPGTPMFHASFAWARAGRWTAAREAIEAEPAWRRESSLLLAHAEACWYLRDVGAARLDWRWLCWEHPLDAERIFSSPRFPDRRLAELWNGFGDLDRILDTEDFPAWLLLQEPGAPASIEPDSVPTDERGIAFRLLRGIVAGDADIELRRELSEIHPQLLRLFLVQKR